MKLKDVPDGEKFLLLNRNKTYTKMYDTGTGCRIKNSSGRTDICDREMEVRLK